MLDVFLLFGYRCRRAALRFPRAYLSPLRGFRFGSLRSQAARNHVMFRTQKQITG